MPANILNLPAFSVQRVEEAEHDYHVYAEVSNPPSTCAACGADRLIGHGRNEQVIRDLPTHGYGADIATLIELLEAGRL